MRLGSLALASLLAAAMLAACAGSGADDDHRLRIATTVSPITSLVENIAGDLAHITGIVPEGTNSHEFEPAPSDARVLAEADVVFVNGLNLEVPSVQLAEANLRRDAIIVRLGEQTITEDEYIYDFSFPLEQGNPNPHLWTNPAYAKRFAELILGTLSRLDPANAEVYQANYEELVGRLDTLDAALREATETVPEPSRKLLTYHDSFPYFAREYGWTVIGAVQPSDFSEPSALDLGALIDQLREHELPAIFGSEVFPSEILAQIARETDARYVDDLRDDDLPGTPGDPEHSLLGLLVFDFRTIVDALGGDSSALDAVDVSPIGAGASYRE
jgi:manganese/iron transport system substrate-binding protein